VATKLKTEDHKIFEGLNIRLIIRIIIILIIIRILNPNANERKDALIKSLAEILWNAGEKSYACVTLNGYKEAFDVSSDTKTKSKSNYVNDGLTEKVSLVRKRLKLNLKISLFSFDFMNSMNINHWKSLFVKI
jgi:hypothetical protein